MSGSPNPLDEGDPSKLCFAPPPRLVAAAKCQPLANSVCARDNGKAPDFADFSVISHSCRPARPVREPLARRRPRWRLPLPPEGAFSVRDYGNCSHFRAIFPCSRSRFLPQNPSVFRNLAPPLRPAGPACPTMHASHRREQLSRRRPRRHRGVRGYGGGSDATGRRRGRRRSIHKVRDYGKTRGTTRRRPRDILGKCGIPKCRNATCARQAQVAFRLFRGNISPSQSC